MSGIAGLFRRDGEPAAPDDLARALAALAPRGPDGRGVWRDGPVALACAQHRTTPQSLAETLPFVDRDRRLTIVHDARLDEREELAATLGLAKERLAETSDGELLAAAWERWGERCPDHLVGDFAFAIWDGKERALFLARDHVGTRALFCYASPRLFAFASELKAVLAIPGVPRRLNPDRVAEFLAGFTPDESVTFYAGIQRFLPGESRLVTAAEVRARRYYRVHLPPQTHRGGPDEVAAGFREVFTASVRDRLRAARPVGATLSGGLDSSAIACVARELRGPRAPAPLPTFTYVFPRTPSADESSFVRAVTDGGGLAPHFIDADAITPLTDVEGLLGAVDEPFHGAPLPYHWAVMRLAAQHGVGVLLDGNGGDSVVSYGLYFLAELARRGRLVRLAREVRGLSRTFRLAPARSLRDYVVGPNIPAFVRRARRMVVGRTARFPTAPLVAVELAQRTDLVERFERFWHSRPAPRSDREHHLGEVVYHLPKDSMEAVGAAFAVEPRFPFLDRRVIEYCLAVPAEHKIQHGVTRMLPRRALAGVLTPAILARTGKSAPTGSLLRGVIVGDRARVEELLWGVDSERAAGYVDLAAARASYRRQVAELAGTTPGRPSATQWQEAEQIHRVAVLIAWLRLTGVAE